MDMLFFQLPLHIFKIHAPDSLFILHKRTVDNVISRIYQTACKADISRRMHQHMISFGTKYSQCTKDTPKHTIFVSDTFFRQTTRTMPRFLPFYNRFKIFLTRIKIPICRMLCPLNNCLRDGRNCLKIHICHPHRNPAEALSHLYIFKRNDIYRNRIFSGTVHNCRKIIFHLLSSLHIFCFPILPYSFPALQRKTHIKIPKHQGAAGGLDRT